MCVLAIDIRMSEVHSHWHYIHMHIILYMFYNNALPCATRRTLLSPFLVSFTWLPSMTTAVWWSGWRKHSFPPPSSAREHFTKMPQWAGSHDHSWSRLRLLHSNTHRCRWKSSQKTLRPLEVIKCWKALSPTTEVYVKLHVHVTQMYYK